MAHWYGASFGPRFSPWQTSAKKYQGPGNACCAKYSEILILLLEKLLVKREDACAMKLRIQVQIFNAGNLEK